MTDLELSDNLCEEVSKGYAGMWVHVDCRAYFIFNVLTQIISFYSYSIIFAMFVFVVCCLSAFIFLRETILCKHSVLCIFHVLESYLSL